MRAVFTRNEKFKLNIEVEKNGRWILLYPLFIKKKSNFNEYKIIQAIKFQKVNVKNNVIVLQIANLIKSLNITVTSENN